MNETLQTKSGFVALIGAPNAGKSTLVNQLVGTKVSIVTHKVQTTRALIRGIVVHDNAQIVLVDTPGIFSPRRRLDRAMVSTAWNGAKDADIVMVIIDAQAGINEEVEAILEALPKINQEKILVLNKVDVIARPTLLELTAKLNEQAHFTRTFMVSALNGSGCRDMPMRQLAAEITREKLYLRLHNELPYASTVETETWEERPDGSVKINQVIYVERDGQKKIVLGAKGETIKAIGQAARKELMEILEQNVHLFLFVKVRDNWGNDPERYREMGLDFSN